MVSTLSRGKLNKAMVDDQSCTRRRSLDDLKVNNDATYTALIKAREKLSAALYRERSTNWCLRLWARYVKTRDSYRCVNCESTSMIHAHHIVRRTLYPWGMFELGNGITLCRDCHHRVHEEFNGKPNLAWPLGAKTGDNQDEWAYLFGILWDDAVKRRINENEYYSIGNFMLRFFVKAQGYEELYESVERGEMSAVRFAHEVWRNMPQTFYETLATELMQLAMRDGSVVSNGG